jgi:CBS domain-containing protein
MSPRAAWRLESVGFQRVYDYVAGKADWGAAGLPLEGTLGGRVGEIARSDAPTCRLDERVADVRQRLRAAGWHTCVVVNDEGIVLGQLVETALDANASVTAEEAMRPGPSTVRPNASIETIRRRIEKHDLTTVIVTRSDGRLVGVVRREDIA